MANLLFFGGTGGTYTELDQANIAGKTLTIYYTGTVISGMQFGNTQYGGTQGSNLKVQIPETGIIDLKGLGTHQIPEHTVLSVIKLSIDGTLHTAGEAEWAILTANLKVKFFGINHGHCIDSLTFEVVD